MRVTTEPNLSSGTGVLMNPTTSAAFSTVRAYSKRVNGKTWTVTYFTTSYAFMVIYIYICNYYHINNYYFLTSSDIGIQSFSAQNFRCAVTISKCCKVDPLYWVSKFSAKQARAPL